MCIPTARPLDAGQLQSCLIPVLLLLLGTLSPQPALSQDAPVAELSEDFQDSQRVTWPDLLRRIDAHPRAQAVRAATQAAAGASREAGAWPNPRWEFGSWRVDARNGLDPTREEDLSVGLPLDWIWTRPAQLRSARSQETQVGAEQMQLGRDLILEAGDAFWTLVRDQALAQATDELSRQLQTLQDAVATRIKVGEARPVEAARMDVEALQAELEASAARRSLDLDRQQLARWLSGAKPQLLIADADLARLPEAPDPGTFQRTRQSAPRLLAARARIDAERGRLSLERLGRMPRVELQGRLERAEDRLAKGAGLALELPLFNWNQGRIDQARASLQEAEAGLAVETRRLDSEAAAATSAYAISRDAARTYQERILPRAEAAVQALEAMWQAGEASLFELIDARRTGWATRREAIEAQYRAQLDGLRLQTLSRDVVE
jgi:cobalt-zinc-cadmium efflux system outer membrane protein